MGKPKKNILIDNDNANYKSNSKLLDKLDEIVENKDKNKKENNQKPC